MTDKQLDQEWKELNDAPIPPQSKLYTPSFKEKVKELFLNGDLTEELLSSFTDPINPKIKINAVDRAAHEEFRKELLKLIEDDKGKGTDRVGDSQGHPGQD